MPTGAGISTTGWSGRVQVDAVSRGEGLLLAAGALVGVLGVLKGSFRLAQTATNSAAWL
jgi:hypothetical protein